MSFITNQKSWNQYLKKRYNNENRRELGELLARKIQNRNYENEEEDTWRKQKNEEYQMKKQTKNQYLKNKKKYSRFYKLTRTCSNPSYITYTKTNYYQYQPIQEIDISVKPNLPTSVKMSFPVRNRYNDFERTFHLPIWNKIKDKFLSLNEPFAFSTYTLQNPIIIDNISYRKLVNAIDRSGVLHHIRLYI
jgi:hypothetical protein